jgi:hypothetical protein
MFFHNDFFIFFISDTLMIIIKGSGGESGANVRLLLHSTKEMSFFCTLWVHLLIEKCRAFGGVDNPVLGGEEEGNMRDLNCLFVNI